MHFSEDLHVDSLYQKLIFCHICWVIWNVMVVQFFWDTRMWHVDCVVLMLALMSMIFQWMSFGLILSTPTANGNGTDFLLVLTAFY